MNLSCLSTDRFSTVVAKRRQQTSSKHNTQAHKCLYTYMSLHLFTCLCLNNLIAENCSKTLASPSCKRTTLSRTRQMMASYRRKIKRAEKIERTVFSLRQTDRQTDTRRETCPRLSFMRSFVTELNLSTFTYNLKSSHVLKMPY